MDAPTYIGKRIACDGCHGTVLYFGPVPPNEGDWLGVDWDDATRGKHDGTHERIKYFTARNPTSGSFIRLTKADFGISYSEAVITKYDFTKDPLIPLDQGDAYIGKNFVMKPIEFIGFDKVGEKQRKFDCLREICLPGMKIYGRSNENRQHLTPNVVELDLSKNLLASWTDVYCIIENCENLKILHLNENRLEISADRNLVSSFKNIIELSLSKVGYDWNNILLCAEMWPKIVKLVIACNNINIISEPKLDLLQNLETLDLDSNPIDGWQEILKLGYLPKLKYLNVNKCGVESIFFPNVKPGEKTSAFTQLQILGLNDNRCDKWTHVAELDKLQNLQELRMRNNPICDIEAPPTTRQLIIAKIGDLKMLNRIQILPGERRGAELDYLKKYGQLWVAINGQKLMETGDMLPSEFASEHPRYLQIVKKYGAAEASEINITRQTLKNKLVSLKISSPLLTDRPPITKKLPLSMTVLKLKSMVEKLLKIENGSIRLSYKSDKSENEDIEFDFDNDLQELSYFSVENGDTIIVRW